MMENKMYIFEEEYLALLNKSLKEYGAIIESKNGLVVFSNEKDIICSINFIPHYFDFFATNGLRFMALCKRNSVFMALAKNCHGRVKDGNHLFLKDFSYSESVKIATKIILSKNPEDAFKTEDDNQLVPFL